jgi:hypothetical protein
MGYWDHPAYGKHRAGSGPRTKKQRRLLRDSLVEKARLEVQEARTAKRIRKMTQEATLHSIQWKP